MVARKSRVVWKISLTTSHYTTAVMLRSAIQLKLDELIRVTRDARNDLLNLEDRPDAELQRLKEQFSDSTGLVTQVANEANKD